MQNFCFMLICGLHPKIDIIHQTFHIIDWSHQNPKIVFLFIFFRCQVENSLTEILSNNFDKNCKFNFTFYRCGANTFLYLNKAETDFHLTTLKIKKKWKTIKTSGVCVCKYIYRLYHMNRSVYIMACHIMCLHEYKPAKY